MEREMGSFGRKGKKAVRSSMYLMPAQRGPLGMWSLVGCWLRRLLRRLVILVLKACSYDMQMHMAYAGDPGDPMGTPTV